jgi:hypothetical protein
MAKLAVEIRMGGLSTYTYPATPAYDSTKLGLGPGIVQQNGTNSEDKWAGPMPIALARPYEQTVAVPTKFVKVVPWSTSIDWVFLADNVNATTTFRVQAWQFNKLTGAWGYFGFITFPAGPAGNRTIRSLVIRYATYTTGTITTSGTTTVTGGNGTAWQTSRLCVGSRIGFGSQDPTTITNWFQIATITGEGTLTTTAAPSTYATDTPYVIEELFVVCAETNATAANGGIWVAKGLRIEDFIPTGTTIPLATGTDNIKAVYLLKDNGTLTNKTAFGMVDQGADSWTQHYIWVGDATTSTSQPSLFKYNIKASLSDIASGYTSPSTVVAGAAFVLNTSVSTTISTAVVTQNDDLILATPNHGPTGANGKRCFYMATSTVGRLYRSKELGSVGTGDATWLTGGGVSVEVPPGGATTYAAAVAGNSLCYIPLIDRFAWFSTGATGIRSYITQYWEDSRQWDRIFLNDTKLINQSGADQSTVVCPNTLSGNIYGAASGNILYLLNAGTTAATNFLYATPLLCDWEYTSITNSVLVTPAIQTPNCNDYCGVYVDSVNILGGDSGKNLGTTTEPFRISYRTSGIGDNTGGWTLLDNTQSLSGTAPASQIQFKIEFRCIGNTNLPARILGVCVVYDDLSTDAHFQPSVAKSDAANKIFAWRFSTAFGTAVPRLRIRLYDAVTGNGPLVDDDSVSQAKGTWQKVTTFGGSWGGFDTNDLATNNIDTYISFTPTTLGDNVKVRALLTLF